MKKNLLLICIMASNSCIAYSNTSVLQSSCERFSFQAGKIMERRQAGVTLETEKQSFKKFHEIYPNNSEDSKSKIEILFNKMATEAHRESIKETDFEKKIMIARFEQKILSNCLNLNGGLFDGIF